MITILDCYTDEPSGLGVPPYLGTYPRYLFGALIDKKPNYITIDDLRLLKIFKKQPEKAKEKKTNIKIFNLTRDISQTKRILDETTQLIIIAGVQTPGKYLSAYPGTLNEISFLIKDFKCKKILTGPAAGFGTRLEGGKFQEKTDLTIYNEINENYLEINNYDKIKDYSIKGAQILKQIPYQIIAELETGKGCSREISCSFCTEPLKSKVEFRESEEIFNEAKALKENGVEHFRLGKQTCFYSYKYGSEQEIEKLLKSINSLNPKVLHIDNANPAMVNEKITQLIVKYCTSGNIAAFGVESFDEEVIEKNHLNTDPQTTYKAIKIINEYGKEQGENGIPKLLPGINIIFGLIGETKKTHEKNIYWLKKILDEDLLLRRINIRQVAIFEGTHIHSECGNKFLKKNKKYYWKWRNEIRQNIDFPMLKKVFPKGTILKDVRMETYDGNHTFGRQFGTYPIIIGINKRIELGKFYNVKIINHMLRSIVGEIV